ncbi:MAG TPA: Stp1/IreP family PP2C-type Ser/Thr phosphatase [Actinomycetota bacterium]|nr:Stp1/IreP family PP2C-type Ser/Thr phosphatase [Actinomycetota bacterium]
MTAAPGGPAPGGPGAPAAPGPAAPGGPDGGPRYAAATDRGLVRANNEDAYLLAPPLYAVADGMGGHRAGEVASAEALQTLSKQAGHDSDSLVAAVDAANAAVYARASTSPDLAGMGTTITAMLTTHDGVQIVHVGDSRAYRLRDGRLRRLTQDHTVVDRLAREGKITQDEIEHHPQRSVLERALGVSPEVDVDVQLIDVHPGDRLLLCTDGLTAMLHDDDIRRVLHAERDPQAATQRLIREALNAGGKDNVTAIVVDFPRAGGPDPDATAEQPVVPLEPAPTLPPTPRRLARPTQALSQPMPGTSAEPAASHRWSKAAAVPPAALSTRPSDTGRGAASWSPTSTNQPPPYLPPTSRRPAGVRLLIGAAVVIPLLVIALIAGWVAVNHSWYVGRNGATVGVFKGVPGSFAGIRISSLQASTTVTVASLPTDYQQRVNQGMSASGKADAQRIVDNLRKLQAPPTGTPAAVTGTVTGTAAPPTGTLTPAVPSPSPKASP